MNGAGKFVVIILISVFLLIHVNTVNTQTHMISEKRDRIDAKADTITKKEKEISKLQQEIKDLNDSGKIDNSYHDSDLTEVGYSYLYNRANSRLSMDQCNLIVEYSDKSGMMIPAIVSILIHNGTFSSTTGEYLNIPKRFYTTSAITHAKTLFTNMDDANGYNELAKELGVLDYYISNQGSVRALNNIYSKGGYDEIGNIYYTLTGSYLERCLVRNR